MLHVNDISSLDASSVAALLREFGQRSALRGGNPFRAKAHARAADNLLTLSLPLDQVIAQDRLREIPGVGDAIADIITKLRATGTPRLKRCVRKSRRAFLEMLTIPGLRADKVLKLHQELGLSSLAELEEGEGRLQKIKGLGASLQTRILRGIEMQRKAKGRWHMHRAAEHYEIARYGTLKTWAGELGLNEAVKLLEMTLSEEKKTDEALTKLALSQVN